MELLLLSKNNQLSLIVLLSSLILLLSNCQAQVEEKNDAPPAKSQESYYTSKRASFDGTGKYYMGREIAPVMGYQGAAWLERIGRDREENVPLAIKNLDLPKNAQVADIGAGSGYYTFRIAEKIPEGQVFAVDLQTEMLEIIQDKIEEGGIKNVQPILANEKDPNLKENSIDLALFVDVYHELSYPREVMLGIIKALRKGGKIVLLEYRAEDPKVPIKRLHKMTAKQARKEMTALGLRFVQNKKMLPWQHFLIFEKP